MHMSVHFMVACKSLRPCSLVFKLFYFCSSDSTISLIHLYDTWGFPQWLSREESVCDAGASRDAVSFLGSGRSPGGGHGSSLQYSCLENPIDREAWQATVLRVAKSWARLK